MSEEQLQNLVESISLTCFGKPFRHRATFNSRLRTTGGRYFLNTHHLEFNPKHLEVFGLPELEKIIKHELCHYHLHLEGKGYRHGDSDFKALLQKVGGSRFCRFVPGSRNKKESDRYQYRCTSCGQYYRRKRKVDTKRFVCGKCHGILQKVET